MRVTKEGCIACAHPRQAGRGARAVTTSASFPSAEYGQPGVAEKKRRAPT